MINRAFNVLTKEAFKLLLTRIPTDNSALVVFDIDNMKGANTTLGKEEVNRRLNSAFSFRSGDTLLGQTFSGDEFAALVNTDDAYGFAVRLRNSLHKHGMSATIVIADYVNEDTFSTTEHEISQLKENGMKDRIVDLRKTK
jgi:GGDEF domain-containing protein